MLESQMDRLQSLHRLIKHHFSEDTLKELVSLLKEQGKHIGEGTSRAVYSLNSDYVAKVPINDKYSNYAFTSLCNLREYLIYRSIPRIPVAHCGLYFYKMIPVIVMEKVDSSRNATKDLRDPEGWNFQDCFQGGVNKEGKYLSYDCGYEKKLLEKLGSDFTPFEFKYFSEGIPNFLNLLKDERTEYLQESLVLTP